ncbi:MAG TPA: alpha/beta hydrolase [Oscillospiraceae bacterium]|nr:alpha/beta hydrolase [Oscillospiraceae bacterium]HPF55767.1 alpha/beta hydrolase [Clostridiales bacterium]HPK35096.1 alpha/beta hydrolase [Oscillospiraceae bacterium]HPR75247.1 alpha/beta hydrolase [Oscillospiraceae bacterium]
MSSVRVFKSEESKNAIRTRYNQILSAFPFRQRYVDTPFAKTFLLECGSPENPPLILLHGSCSNSAFWFSEIMALSAQFHVFAADIPGEAGNTEENRLNLRSDDYADWLKAVFDALSIKQAVVMGNSLGSWMALKFAVKYPEYVSKLIIIAPSGLSHQNDKILEKAKQSAQQNEDLTIDSSISQGIELPKEVLEFINLIGAGYYPITEELPAFSDEQLKRLTMPVLFVAGKLDVMVDAPAAAKRLGNLLPHAEIRLLENIGHMVLNALEYIIPFAAK